MSVLDDVAKLSGQFAAAAAAAAAIAKLTKRIPAQPFGDLTFPADLNDQYYFTLTFSEYQRQSLLEVGNGALLGNIRLPIPNNLSDTYSVNYETADPGTALGGAANALGGLGAGQGITADSAKGAAKDIGIAAAGAALNNSGAVGGLLGAFMGQTTNPFMTVLFKNPNYKQYSFSWRLYPRNTTDMQNLLSIIAKIRYCMLPSASAGSGGNILSYPSLARCMIKTRAGELYPFRYAVVKNATFNYGPDGTPSFHTDGLPSSVDIKIDLEEVEYFLRENLP
jgi:hypothetical protein